MAKLQINWSDGRTQEYALKRTVTMIGRTSDNDLKLSDRGISRKQCKIEGKPGSFSLIDLDSKNGTMVNGTKVAASALRNKDVIVIGNIRIVFMEDEPAAENESGTPDGNGCPTCGAPLREGDVLCIKCGTFLKKSASMFTAEKIRDSWMSWVILAIVLTGLLILGFFLTGNGSENRGGGDHVTAIKQIVRSLPTPTTGTYGELFDKLNLADGDLSWSIEDRGLEIYRIELRFELDGEEQLMVFKVDMQSGDGEDELQEFNFEKF